MTNINHKHCIAILFLTGFLCLDIVSGQAQERPFNPEAGTPSQFPKVNDDDNTPDQQNVDADIVTLKPAEVDIKKPKDKPAQVKATNKQESTSSSGSTPNYGNGAEDSAESVLSFNFLYYIIQRFKFTDVVDQ